MLGGAAPGPMSCVCSVACVAEEPPKFLILALKVVCCFFSLGLVVRSVLQKQLVALPGFNPAALGSLCCEKPGLRGACVCSLFVWLVCLFVEVVMSDTGREEKKSGWFQDNFVKNYVKLHCSKKNPSWMAYLLSDSLLK